MIRLGVVSFLNARPLVCGLQNDPTVTCVFDVPATLPERLDRGQVDAALIPTIDLLRAPDRYRVVSDACIGCDGETMTVRVFSQVPPDRLQTLWVDPDSHTSIALARVLWRLLYDRDLTLHTLSPQSDLSDLESVLLIGDKVMDPARGSFAYEVDLGGAWRQHTGLPFVFAVWAGLRENAELAEVLSAARDRGVATAAEIAASDGPALGWPVETARRYLTRCLRYVLDARAAEGVELFARHCAEAGLVPADTRIRWPAPLASLPTSLNP